MRMAPACRLACGCSTASPWSPTMYLVPVNCAIRGAEPGVFVGAHGYAPTLLLRGAAVQRPRAHIHVPLPSGKMEVGGVEPPSEVGSPAVSTSIGGEIGLLSRAAF